MRHRWTEIVGVLLREPPGTRLRVPRHLAEHPLDGGLVPSSGRPVGQRADYRLALAAARSLHVRDYASFYDVHVDDHPQPHAWRQLASAPGVLATGAALVGGVFGLLLGRRGRRPRRWRRRGERTLVPRSAPGDSR